jgi:hypothetical protein
LSFTYSQFDVFSKIEAIRPTVESNLGGYFLEFEIALSPINPSKGGLMINDLNVSVAFGNERGDLGVASPAPTGGMPDFVVIRRQPHGQHDVHIRFRLCLSVASLEAVEEKRAGSDANFRLRIYGTVTGYDADEKGNFTPAQDIAWPGQALFNAGPSYIFRPQKAFEDILLSISQSEWCHLLEKAGYRNTIFLEIPAYETGAPRKAWYHIKDAQTAFFEGRFTDVATRCRDALDSMIPTDETGAGHLWNEAGKAVTRKKMPVEDAFRVSWLATHLITNAGHHRNDLSTEFTRSMAQYILGATCLALSLASRERDLFKRPKPVI